MAYTKQNWQTGETITADKLNHMEDGIKNNTSFNSVPVVFLQRKGNPGDGSEFIPNEYFNTFKQVGQYLYDIYINKKPLLLQLIQISDDGNSSPNFDYQFIKEFESTTDDYYGDIIRIIFCTFGALQNYGEYWNIDYIINEERCIANWVYDE